MRVGLASGMETAVASTVAMVRIRPRILRRSGKRPKDLLHFPGRVVHVRSKAQVAVSHRTQHVLCSQVRLNLFGGNGAVHRAHEAGGFGLSLRGYERVALRL